DFLSTRWRCGWGWAGCRADRRCWRGRARWRWGATIIRRCRSSGWWRRCIRSAVWVIRRCFRRCWRCRVRSGSWFRAWALRGCRARLWIWVPWGRSSTSRCRWRRRRRAGSRDRWSTTAICLARRRWRGSGRSWRRRCVAWRKRRRGRCGGSNWWTRPPPASTHGRCGDAASVVSLVEAQVLLRPGSVAVEGGGEGLRYGALWSRSGTLAARLRGLGVGPDRVVGLCLDRAVGTVVSVLAVWRAGGAYVAIDPTYPDARLDYLIRDSGAVAVLSRGGDAARIEGLLAADPGSRRVAVLDLDRFDDNDAGPLSALPDPPHPDALAYVIYTSGSTGQPKPVAVSHAGLANLARQQIAGFAVAPASRVLQFASWSFDASVSELAMALGSGAILVVAPTSVPGDVAALARLLADEAIAVVQVVPSLLAALLECPELDAARALRLVFC